MNLCSPQIWTLETYYLWEKVMETAEGRERRTDQIALHTHILKSPGSEPGSESTSTCSNRVSHAHWTHAWAWAPTAYCKPWELWPLCRSLTLHVVFCDLLLTFLWKLLKESLMTGRSKGKIGSKQAERKRSAWRFQRLCTGSWKETRKIGCSCLESLDQKNLRTWRTETPPHVQYE